MIVLVIGPPASGKTTFCSNQPGFRHIEIDRLLPRIDQSTSSYKEERRKMIELILQGVDKPTIIDDTLHIYSMRRPFLKRAAELGVGFGIYQMPYQNLNVLLERNRSRSNNISDASLIKVFNSFEPLRPSEQRFLITSLTQVLLIPPRFTESVHLTTRLHDLDLRLRKIAHNAIACLKTKEEGMIRAILEARRSLLAEAKDEMFGERNEDEDYLLFVERFEKWLSE